MNGRTVILHADDVGMCHGANQAFLQLARAGAIDCGSVMVPCPWFREVAAMADRHKLNLRIGAYMLAIERVAAVHRLRGMYA